VLAPQAAHWDAQSIFPKDALARPASSASWACTRRSAAGGLALSRLDASLIVEELAARLHHHRGVSHHPQHGDEHDRPLLLATR
jgi:hypothetical protein